jgi:hypothetical protein
MPIMPLATLSPGLPLQAEEPGGTRLTIPTPQFRCLIRPPGLLLPRDAVIDTGSPLSWLPEAIWSRLRIGSDYEFLPWPSGFTPPPVQTAGWNFTFRIARLVQPIILFNFATGAELTRDRVVVQLADGNPPAAARSNAPPRVVIGLWGGVLEGTSLRISPAPAPGHLAGALEW